MGAAGAGGGRQLWPVVLFFSGSCRRPRPALTPSLFPLEDRRLLRPVHLKTTSKHEESPTNKTAGTSLPPRARAPPRRSFSSQLAHGPFPPSCALPHPPAVAKPVCRDDAPFPAPKPIALVPTKHIFTSRGTHHAAHQRRVGARALRGA